ncbi:TetR/AcrR family transcriptional regulator [Amycolatopsis jiangsuensis]|uniref:AcrR family transcriptional regulator n=1 Tax=Amycolatopsis jiangsuensis TaxID=1181879 RepID=A0A840IP71_9PSEU|nr:TetR family transcriptional regulator [Amycolatopsis jiangsuensis]MBB4683157.1 AcrR family transcriptional regulator [Amycolatopsis jiangsuensis]
MVTFQRARSDEQREIRRQAILDTTAAMIAEMPVKQVSLNELSRRVGLAKSNVLRYFESREEILLELLDRAWRRWTADLRGQPADRPAPGTPARRRADDLAALLTQSLVERPLLCELLSAQVGVLEYNVSPAVVAHYKKSSLGNLRELATLVRERLPELGEDAEGFCGQTIIVIGAIWTHAHPSESMRAAYQADDTLTAHCVTFGRDLQDLLTTLLTGALARK